MMRRMIINNPISLTAMKLKKWTLPNCSWSGNSSLSQHTSIVKDNMKSRRVLRFLYVFVLSFLQVGKANGQCVSTVRNGFVALTCSSGSTWTTIASHLGTLAASVTQQVKYLSLANNSLTQPTTTTMNYLLFQVLQLYELDFSRNSLPLLSATFSDIWSPITFQRLLLTSCNIGDIEDDVFMGYNELQYLYLDHNHLRYLRPGVFSSMSKLQYIDLSYNTIAGVWSASPSFVPVWPNGLLALNLANNPAATGAGREWTTYLQWTNTFFLDMVKLLDLNVKSTSWSLSAEHFRPLRSLQRLVLASSVPTSFSLLVTLRELEFSTDAFLSANLKMSTFRALHLLETVTLYKGSLSLSCSATLGLRDWIHNRAGLDNVTVIGHDVTTCDDSGTQMTIKKYWDSVSDLSDDYCFSNSTSNVTKSVVYANTSSVGKAKEEIDLITWDRIYTPTVAILAITAVVLFLVAPSAVYRVLCFIEERPNKPDFLTPPKKKNDVMTGSGSLYTDIDYLREEFHSTTLINGFYFAYHATWQAEKVIWYLLIVAFGGLFIHDTATLWVNWRYGEPRVAMTVINEATFPQTEFTICMPIVQRNVNITVDDIRALLGSACKADVSTDTTLFDNGLFLDAVLLRMSKQMEYETMVVPAYPELTPWMLEMDAILAQKKVTYRKMLMAASKALCRRWNIHAYGTLSGPLGSTTNVEVNPAGCEKLFDKETYGIRWYSIVETNRVVCVRFPGIFDFESYDLLGGVRLSVDRLYYDPTYAIVDVYGQSYPMHVLRYTIPARARLHYKTSVKTKVNSHHLMFQWYKSSETKRCDRNCRAQAYVDEIQAKCTCRPLMWTSQSTKTLPDCTVATYKKCNMTNRAAGVEDLCATMVPCDFWDYDVSTIEGGPTEDNSTYISFDGMNTQFSLYEELEGDSLGIFMGNVGGTLGLWLGASIMACIHVVIFFGKTIYIVVKKQIAYFRLKMRKKKVGESMYKDIDVF